MCVSVCARKWDAAFIICVRTACALIVKNVWESNQGTSFQARKHSVRQRGLPVQTKIRAVNYIRFTEKLTFRLLDVTECQCFHHSRPRGQTGFPPIGSSWLHKYGPENKHVIGVRATGKARQSACDVAAENKSHFPSLSRRFLKNGILFGF